MALPNPSAGDSVAAAHIQSLKNHLEGAATYTAPYHFRQSSGSLVITLPDNAGATKVRVNDSDAVEVFSVDSNGNISQSGTFSPSSLVLPASASPSQTTDAQIIWDSDDDHITVGTGTATQKYFSNEQGTDVASASTLAIGSGGYFAVTGTTTITGISSRPAGKEILLKFASALTLTHNATSFILYGSASRTTRAGEMIRFVSEGSGNWREVAIGYPFPLVLGTIATVNASTTLTTALTYPMAASGVYMVRGLLVYTSGTTPDMKYGLLGPANCVGNMIYSGVVAASWSTTVVVDTDMSSPTTFAVDGAGATTRSITRFEAMITNSTAGNLELQFAQNTSNASDTSLVVGSTMDVVRVA